VTEDIARFCRAQPDGRGGDFTPFTAALRRNGRARERGERVFTKLNVVSRFEAIAAAARRGMVQL
jgi:hypothetical protein